MSPAAGNDGGAANHNVVFVDTSLDTHLAMIVSESDTVSDFKRKIMVEHRQLFPTIGDIKVECLKIKRRGSFYHLSDTMLVKTAFGAAKRNWFVSVDASRLEQNDGIQHSGKHKAEDQLALPWVTHSRSIERHDNHGSPSIHSKIVPFVNQKVLNVDRVTSGDSCKDVLKNVEEDRSCNDKQLDYELQEKLYTVNTDVNSKKRTRDVHDESSLKDAFETGPSAKKKRKTQRVKSNVKASDENIAFTHDNDKVNDKGTSINNENSFEQKSKGKDSSDENNRTNKGENCSGPDQLATAVLGIEGVGSETGGDVAMVVENNIQQEMSARIYQKDKDSELAQKPATENEIHSSLTRTPDCEHGAAGVTATGYKKRSTEHKAAEKEVFSTSFIKKLQSTNKDAIESSSHQDVGSNGQECTGDQIDKYNDDSEVSLKHRPELKLPEKKKGAMGCENIGEGKRRKTKKLFKHPDNLVGDVSSTVPASVIDERKMNEDSEKTLIDAKKGDGVIEKEMEISVENKEEKSREEFSDTNDVVTATNEDNLLPHSESLMNNDAQGILDNLEKQNEKTDNTSKKRKKRKTKKSAGRNKDELITKHVDGDIYENAKEGESSLPDVDRKDGDMSSTILASVIDERKMNGVAEETLIDAKKGDDVIVEEVEISVEDMEEKSMKEFTDTNDAEISTTGKDVNAQGILDNLEKQNEKTDDTMKNKKKRKTKKSDEVELESKKSQSVDQHRVPEKALKNVAASEVSKVNDEVDITEDRSHELNFRDYFAPGHQPNRTASIDNWKDMKKTKDDSRNDQFQKLVSKCENNKVSVDVLKVPNITNIDKMKTPKRTKKIDVQKTNKQQSISGQTHINTVKKKSVNRSQQVKSLLNTPGTIFGDDSDDNASVNSDSSTRSPSRKPYSSSSGQSASLYSTRSRSLARKRQEGAGKNNINSESKSKDQPMMNDLLRRSSGFKKAKVTASSQVEDTESQPVDFVPDSQPTK
ncbi:hypothetical protein L1987_83799 [Smallanthus sonchifolius]|uniref:Uncharacterized protein n=1 Tax=Smallanthus sonchifolius TaxID=185202 RepID=A0ACB8YD12_9ASTR|nr:hypothetical protein L1987_83799 [Smallanthus sonchifolius]